MKLFLCWGFLPACIFRCPVAQAALASVLPQWDMRSCSVPWELTPPLPPPSPLLLLHRQPSPIRPGSGRRPSSGLLDPAEAARPCFIDIPTVRTGRPRNARWEEAESCWFWIKSSYWRLLTKKSSDNGTRCVLGGRIWIRTHRLRVLNTGRFRRSEYIVRIKQETENQYSGSGSTGSTCFWASRIRIH